MILACAAAPSGAQNRLNLLSADAFYGRYLKPAIGEGLYKLRDATRPN